MSHVRRLHLSFGPAVSLALIASLLSAFAVLLSPKAWADGTRAIAVLQPTQGNQTSGIVTFSEMDGGVHVTAKIQNLSPGSHGFHIHVNGDCSAANGDSAGGHFNPASTVHGAPTAHERHSGDLGNIVADKQGNASLEIHQQGVMLSGENSLLGRSVIVHAQPDDLLTQPTGNAGGRLACGVIGRKAP